MKKIIALLLCFITICSYSYAAEAPKTPTPKTPSSQESDMPENFKQWEQENAGREVIEESRYGELWSKTLLLLIVILLFLFVGTWYLKRFGVGIRVKDSNKDSRIQILEKRVISPKAVVYLLSIDGVKVALSETSSGIQVLSELTRTPKPFSLDLPQKEASSP